MIEGVSTSTAAFIGTAQGGDLDTPTLVTSFTEFLRRFGDFDAGLGKPYLAPSVSAFFTNGGKCAYIVRVADSNDEAYVGVTGNTRAPTGIQSLRTIDGVNIVCIPGVTSLEVQRALIVHCEEMGNRFALLDSEENADVDSLMRQRQGLHSDRGHAALYHPWVRAFADNAPGPMLPPGGFVAGVYARTDQEQGVWKAPTGEVRRAVGLKLTIDQREGDTLNTAGINTLRAFPGKGIRLWGARTIAADPQWKYVNLRRFLNYLEASIERGTRWAVFEPNDEALWLKLRSDIENFLQEMWKGGALLGNNSHHAFYARCDHSTMTQEDIIQRRVIVEMGVAIQRPGEFFILRLVLSSD